MGRRQRVYRHYAGLPGCVTQGRSQDGALERVHEAITVHIESLEASGEPVPVEGTAPQLAAVEI